MAELFTWSPDWNASLSEEVRVRQTNFGDGYSQRSFDGLNPTKQIWAVSFAGRDKATISAIANFLRRHREGGIAFEFLLPDTAFAVVGHEFGVGTGARTQFILTTPSEANYASPTASTYRPAHWDPLPGVEVNGVPQTPGVDYTLASSGLVTFTVAPALGASITVTGTGQDKRLVIATGRGGTSIAGVNNHSLSAEFEEVLA